MDLTSLIDLVGECSMFDENHAIGHLLREGWIFVTWENNQELSLAVNCNDIFAWGCADAEDLERKDLENLWKEYLADPKTGYIKWSSKKRNEKPQKPVIDWMKREGTWTNDLDNLPDNNYDSMLKNTIYERKNNKST